jgi:hypothetical protein
MFFKVINSNSIIYNLTKITIIYSHFFLRIIIKTLQKTLHLNSIIVRKKMQRI